MSDLTNRNIIKQSYALVEARYKLSALSQNIFNALLTEIKNEDIQFRSLSFSIPGLEKKLNEKINREYLKKASREIRQIEINIRSTTSKSFIDINLVTSFAYNEKTKMITANFNSDLIPYVLQLKREFAIGYLNEMVAISGEYNKRMYMILRKHTFQGEYRVNVDELRTMLKTPRVMNEYKRLKEKLINPCIREINENTSLSISLEEIRENRAVKTIIFKIKDIKGKKISSSKNYKQSNAIESLEAWTKSENEEIIEVEAID